MKIYIGSDHRGFALKKKVAEWLKEWGYHFTDIGANEYVSEDDYTEYASKVASLVVEHGGGRGVLLCGSGVGVDVTANKFDGVRASIGKEVDQVKAGRADDDMNVLVIAADFTGVREAKSMLKAFLETKFDGKPRHKRRLSHIKHIEANN